MNRYVIRSEPAKRPGWFIALEGRGAKRTQVLPGPGVALFETMSIAEKALIAALDRGELER